MTSNYSKNFSGVILAGGQSNRMGFPKACLLLKGKRMIDIILEVFHPLFDEILIVTHDKKRLSEFKGIKVIEDLVKGYGPLGGIYTGLKAISNDKAFFVACDMPLLHNELIKKILNTSMQNDYQCVVPCTPDKIEPLHAVYSNKILRTIEDLLKGKDFSINQLLKRCRCKYVRACKSESSSFFNINTPEDLRALESYENKI